ncbi:tRNA-specific adenosine deaminase 1 [Zerene cesonia]|uniref:tRNA-specific adenosine deaminase 1 n=1 Tax=Zerene cesonia TaxID=33412 RepID=UPI0018E4E4E7|nr:tRNA-specific adenosine deaminase 1 [Zerene cesonia]
MRPLKQSIVDDIVKECLETYSKLPKTGKPVENEWTVLSCVIQYDMNRNDYKVIALGTGSKCIGASKMSPNGNILNDSHAEIIARRGFLLYLYDNIEQCLQNKSSIFVLNSSMCTLKPNIDFVFYSSQLPCGDASIIPKVETLDDQVGDIICSSKRAAIGDVDDDYNCKKSKINDIHRTGAKCLENSVQDPKLPGKDYHLLGQVRTKPGRGDRTLSMSCSDKIARWIHSGIHGSLIDMLLLEPIYINHFIFGAEVPYCEESLKRAFFTRNITNTAKLNSVPCIYQSTLPFPHIRSEEAKKPAPSSIIWRSNGSFEVAVQGKKLGVTKKNENILGNYLSICKFNLFKKFQSILNENEEWKQRVCGSDQVENTPYNEMKRKSTRYIYRWNEVKESFFKIWTRKPDIFTFKVMS